MNSKLKKQFGAISAGDSAARAYEDLLVILGIGLSNRQEPDKSVRQLRERWYFDTLNRYSKAKQRIFPEILASLTLEIDKWLGVRVRRDRHMNLTYHSEMNRYGERSTYHDVLGELASELGLYKSKPSELRLNEDKVEAEIELRGYTVLEDKSCGSGQGVLEALNYLVSWEVEPQGQVVVEASDVDSRNVLMTYIQLSLSGVAAVVRRGSSSAWYSPSYISEGWYSRRDMDR